MSIISRLRAVVAGDDYLDGEYDDLDYETDDQMDMDHNSDHARGGALAPPSESSPFDLGGGFSSSNVIGMPGIASASAEVNLME
ncbi:MAG: cell division protein SepF, partial [Prochlorococcus sp.]